MLRRLLGLMIALAIALALPTLGPAAAMPGMAPAADCACADANQGCDEHGKPVCDGMLACTVQCTVAVPMLNGEIGASPMAPVAASHLMTAVMSPPSTAAAPPLRPPTASILA